jgi:prephenate dehydratase
MTPISYRFHIEFEKDKSDDKLNKFVEVIQKLHVNIPLLDAM